VFYCDNTCVLQPVKALDRTNFYINACNTTEGLLACDAYARSQAQTVLSGRSILNTSVSLHPKNGFSKSCSNFAQDVLAAQQIGVGVRLGILVRVVSPEQRHKRPHSFCCVPSAPVICIEHITDFRRSYGTDETDDARCCLLA
jgi:hypothetical protein